MARHNFEEIYKYIVALQRHFIEIKFTNVRKQWLFLWREKWGRDRDGDLAVSAKFNVLHYQHLFYFEGGCIRI